MLSVPCHFSLCYGRPTLANAAVRPISKAALGRLTALGAFKVYFFCEELLGLYAVFTEQ